MDDIRKKLLPIFLDEADQHLKVIETALQYLAEGGGLHDDTLAEGHRSAHSIKGTAALVRLEQVSATAQKLEDLFDAMVATGTPLSQGTGQFGALLQHLRADLDTARSNLDSPAADHLHSEGHSEEPPVPLGEEDELEQRPELVCCAFQSGGKTYSLAVEQMMEISELPSLTPLPLAPPYIEGLANLRGVVLPVVNMGALLTPLPRRHPAQRYLVIAEGGGDPIAFSADAVPNLETAIQGEVIDVCAFIERHRIRTD